MTHYNTFNIKSSNSRLNELKPGIKNNTGVLFSSNVVGNSNDENNFPRELLLTNTQVSKLCRAFASNSSASIRLSKTQFYETRQSGEFLVRLLLKTWLPLIGNVLKQLAKSVLIPLGLTAAAPAIDAAIHKKKFGSGNTTLIILNEEMYYIMKIIKSLEESALLIEGVSQTLKNEAKKQKGRFLSKLLGTLGASLLVNLLAGKGTATACEGAIAASLWQETVRASQDF